MEQARSLGHSSLSLPELAARITELAGHLNAANHQWLTLIAEFDRRNGWSDAATQSCAHWLNWQCGIALGAAREKVRVAHALESLPLISASMARGELSYSKVRALTRVANADTEQLLLDIALHGTAHHVETVVRHFRRAQEAEELSRDARRQANRAVHYFFDDDGSLVIKARLPAEAGALVLKALDAAMPEVAQADVPAGTSLAAPLAQREGGGVRLEDRPTVSARRADALAIVAESFLKHGAKALTGGERQQIVVHIDADTLVHVSHGRCELDEGPALASETVRRLACDASVVRIVENGVGQTLDVGRKTRSIPPALRRALTSRDRGCRFPGCTHTRFVDGHHIHHWAHGGETKLSNLVSLCRFHHRLVHEGRVRVQVLGDGALRFVGRDGECCDSVAAGHSVPLANWGSLVAAHRDRSVHIDKSAAATRWRGEPIDYGLATELLLQRTNRERGVPAGTSLR